MHANFLQKKDFFKKNGLFTYLAQLELDYNCNSLCEPSFFSIHQDMSKGVPKQECIGAPAKVLQIDSSDESSYRLIRAEAILSIVIGALILVAFISNCVLRSMFVGEKQDYNYVDHYD